MKNIKVTLDRGKSHLSTYSILFFSFVLFPSRFIIAHKSDLILRAFTVLLPRGLAKGLRCSRIAIGFASTSNQDYVLRNYACRNAPRN